MCARLRTDGKRQVCWSPLNSQVGSNNCSRGTDWNFRWRPRPSNLLVRGERAGAPTRKAPTRLPASSRSFSSTMKRNCGARGGQVA